MYDLLFVREISFVRTCGGGVIKATDCSIKATLTRGNIKVMFLFIKNSDIQLKSAWQPLLPSAKGLSFTFSAILLLCKSQNILLLFQPYYSPLGKHYVVRKDPGTYIQLNIYDHELLLLTIIPEVNKLGGETLNPHLPLCLMETGCSKNMLWVPAIIRRLYDSWVCEVC